MRPQERIQSFLGNAMGLAGHQAQVWAVDQPTFEAIQASATESESLPSIVHTSAGDIGLETHEGRVVTDYLYSVQVRGSTPDEVSLMLEHMARLTAVAGGDFTFEHETGSEVSTGAVEFYWQIITLRVAPHGPIPTIRMADDILIYGPTGAPLRLDWGGGTVLEW